MTEILIRVSSGKRPGVEKIPEEKPPECEDMIGVIQQCWHQDCTMRPAFSGNKPHFCSCFCLMKTIIRAWLYTDKMHSKCPSTELSYSSEITMSKQPILLHLLSASQFFCDCFFLRSRLVIKLFDLVTAIMNFNIHCLCSSIKVV